MGCGAMCGNINSVHQPNWYSQKTVYELIPFLNHKKQFVSAQQFDQFTRQVKQNPLKYQLKVSNKLAPKEQIQPGIFLKWKVILYCLGSSNYQYIDCLGRKAAFQNQGIKMRENNESKQEGPEGQYNLPQQSVIRPHEQFSQIQKDIDRTCDLADMKKKSLEKILKLISNNFPLMGYTQGINFIIGYLLMIGYSEFDTFWIFVHIAINSKYLLLGLFEDGFPLTEIYKAIFKSIIKRENNQLYQHLYSNLNIDQSMWVFKWFFTCFIYSFPHQMVKYVFDLVIEIGSIGLVTFAFAITEQISAELLSLNDVCDISLFFQSLKDIHVFNQYISINKLVGRAYTLEIRKQDFSGISTENQNFYSSYLRANIESPPSQKQEPAFKEIQVTKLQVTEKRRVGLKTNQNPFEANLLKKWYEKLTNERIAFFSLYTGVRQNDRKEQRISIQNQLLLKSGQQTKEQKSTKSIKPPQNQQKSINQNKNSIKDSAQLKDITIPSTGCSFDKKSSRLKIGDQVSQIDEMWQQQDINSCLSGNISSRISQLSRTQNGFNNPVKKNQYEDELDKFASTHNNTLGKKSNYTAKSSSIFPVQKQSTFKPKVNNYQIQSNKNKASKLAQIGQNILTNLSIVQNSGCGSQTSQCQKYSQKQRRSKQNATHSKNSQKSKIEKLNLYDQNQGQTRMNKRKSQTDRNSSSKDSYVYPQNSFYNLNQFNQEQIKESQHQAVSARTFDLHRQRMSTQQDIIINSLHSSHIRGNNSIYAVESIASQIQIFEAPQVFKKRNNVSSRITGAQKSTPTEGLQIVSFPHMRTKVSVQKDQNSFKKVKICLQESLNYQESYESIMAPSQGKKSDAIYQDQQLQKCEVESVK